MSQDFGKIEQKDVLCSFKTASLIATYEELLQVSEAERITHYFGDYGGHFFNDGVADSQIDAAYEKALEVMGMDSDTFQGNSAYLYRGEIIGRMRDRLLSETLETGTQVLFVATEPYGGPGDFCLRGGVIQGIDHDRLTCSVRGSFFTMEDVPLHYVLGRYDRNAPRTHYGYQYVEPLFGEHPALADHYLREVEAQYNALRSGEQEAAPTMEL